jgi:hypothetical protein
VEECLIFAALLLKQKSALFRLIRPFVGQDFEVLVTRKNIVVAVATSGTRDIRDLSLHLSGRREANTEDALRTEDRESKTGIDAE